MVLGMGLIPADWVAAVGEGQGFGTSLEERRHSLTWAASTTA
jgi:hypothetical protein